MGAVNTLFTFEEFERMDSKPGKQELIQGELLKLPPEPKPQKISSRVFLPLNQAIEQAQAHGKAAHPGVTCYETGYKFSGNSYALEVWHADQRKRSFTIFHPDGSSVLEEDEAVTTSLSPGFSLRVADVFGA